MKTTPAGETQAPFINSAAGNRQPAAENSVRQTRTAAMSADEVGWRRGKEHDEGVGLEATVQQTTPATPAAVRGLRTRASAVDEGALSVLLLLRLSAVADI
jgi:hypothetical protein